MSQQSDFAYKEVINPNNLISREIRILVPRQLQERRIYLYTEVLLTAAASFVFASEVVPLLGGFAVGTGLPATICDFTGTTPIQSAPNLFNGGGSPVGDSLSLRLAQPFTTDTAIAVIQPYRINIDCDTLLWRITGVAGSTLQGYRAFLACTSTKY